MRNWGLHGKSMANPEDIHRVSWQRRLAAEAPPSCQWPRSHRVCQGSPATGQSLAWPVVATGELCHGWPLVAGKVLGSFLDPVFAKVIFERFWVVDKLSGQKLLGKYTPTE